MVQKTRVLVQLLRALVFARGARRRQVLRLLLWELAGRVAPTVSVRDEDLTYLVSTSDHVIGRELFSGVSPEFSVSSMRATMAAVADVLGRDFLQGRTFVDVGANIGTTTVPAAALFGAGRAIAVEPSPANRRLLGANVAMNDIADKVRIIGAAVSSSARPLILELSPDNHGDHRVRVNDATGDFGEETRTTISVPGRRLDEILASSGVDAEDVGLVWIDTQGFEGEVLESAGDLLGAVPVLMEYAPYWLDRAGGLDAIRRHIGRYGAVIDMRTKASSMPDDLDELLARYTIAERNYTELLLVPAGPRADALVGSA